MLSVKDVIRRATVLRDGLLRKLSGVASEVMHGDGNWAAVSGDEVTETLVVANYVPLGMTVEDYLAAIDAAYAANDHITVIEVRTDDPPLEEMVEGRIWFRSDL